MNKIYEKNSTPDDRQRQRCCTDLAWVLGVLENWLLVAEPATVHELAAYLRSIGSRASTSDVFEALARCRFKINR
jgi:hypothetical protein